jgi:hypothetical protein
MALTELYVDPSIDADSGSGTSGSPYGDLQYCLNQETLDTVNGTRINIKDSATENITGVLSFATFGTPAAAGGEYLMFEGYTSTAGDGGVFTLDGGGGNYQLIAATACTGFHLKNGIFQNVTTSAYMVALDNDCSATNCEFHNCSGGALTGDSPFAVSNCFFSDVESTCIDLLANGVVDSCLFYDTGGSTILNCIFASGNVTVRRCMASLNATTGRFINTTADGLCVYHNTVLQNAACTDGCILSDDINDSIQSIWGNIFEGYSGVGGHAIELPQNRIAPIVAYNAFYNNSTNMKNLPPFEAQVVDNETLSQSGIAKSGSVTWANRKTYFAPVDTGNVIGGTPDGLDKGAVQSAGGTTQNIIIPRPRRIM